MPVKNLPVLLSGYRLTIVDLPVPKTRDDGSGGQVVVVDRNGATQFVVSLFLKALAAPGERAPKGEEIKVTLETDPGPGFEEGDRVELINPRINSYQIDTEDGRSISGIAFKALGLKPAGATATTSSGVHGVRGGEDR
jgi:hypothetical protein